LLTGRRRYCACKITWKSRDGAPNILHSAASATPRLHQHPRRMKTGICSVGQWSTSTASARTICLLQVAAAPLSPPPTSYTLLPRKPFFPLHRLRTNIFLASVVCGTSKQATLTAVFGHLYGLHCSTIHCSTIHCSIIHCSRIYCINNASMRFLSIALVAAASLLSSTLSQATFSSSPKRGLIHITSKYPAADDPIWTKGDLTWYYNYQIQPTAAYASIPQSQFEFVPQLWGLDNNFLSSVVGLINGGRSITHVLTYNEPDGSTAYGGSDITPAAAATNWISQVEPLRKMGIKVGAPAVTGSQGGFTWLADFFASCQSQGSNCTVDFYPVHWYGDFEGLASHLGQMIGT